MVDVGDCGGVEGVEFDSGDGAGEIRLALCSKGGLSFDNGSGSIALVRCTKGSGCILR